MNMPIKNFDPLVQFIPRRPSGEALERALRSFAASATVECSFAIASRANGQR